MKTLLLFWVVLTSFQTSARPTFPTFPDSGDVVYERQPEAVLQAWSQALLAEPQHPSYPTFVALCRYQQQHQIWELTLQAIQSEHPEEWRYARDLADAWFQQGKIVQADSLLIEFDEEPSTDFWLLKAKINFQQQSDAAGQAGYERALALVQTQADAQLILADLLYLISDAYSVWPYSKETDIENPRKKKPIIRTGTRQNGAKRDEKVWMSFDFSEQKKGKYVIEILVEDQVGGAEVRKLVPVEVE